MSRLFLALLLLSGSGCAGSRALTGDSTPENAINIMVEAYAKRDLDAMMAVFHEDIEWM